MTPSTSPVTGSGTLPDLPFLHIGKLIAGPYPLGVDGRNPDILARLLDAGVRAFIDLTEAGELRPYTDLLPPHVNYVRVPVVDGDVATDDQIRTVQRIVTTATRLGLIYLHCRAGCGRTATTLVAAQLVDGDEPTVRFRLAVLADRVGLPACPETDVQEAVLRANINSTARLHSGHRDN